MYISIKTLKISVTSISDVKEITASDLEIAFLPANKCLVRWTIGTQSAGKQTSLLIETIQIALQKPDPPC